MAGATSRAHLGHASLLGFKRVQRFCANPRTSLILHFSYHHGKKRLLSVSMLVPRVVVLILQLGEYAAPTKQWIAEDSEVRNNQWWRLRKQRSGQRQAGNTFNDLITKVSGQLGFRQSLTTPHLHYNAEEEIGIEVHMVDAHGYGDVSRLPGFHKILQKLLKI